MPCRIKKIFIFTKFVLCFSLINFYFFSYSIAFSDVSKNEIDNVYELLQQKKFNEGVEQLKALSLKNNIDAQLLYSKILFTGDIKMESIKNTLLMIRHC